jgi:hypothetical protein
MTEISWRVLFRIVFYKEWNAAALSWECEFATTFDIVTSSIKSLVATLSTNVTQLNNAQFWVPSSRDVNMPSFVGPKVLLRSTKFYKMMLP